MNLELLRLVERLTEEEEDEVTNAIVMKREQRERAAFKAIRQSMLEGIQPSTERFSTLRAG